MISVTASDRKPGDEEEGTQMVNGTGKHKPAKPSNKKEKSVLQGKLTRLAIQIGYFGTVAAVLTILVLIIKFCVEKFMVGENMCKVTKTGQFQLIAYCILPNTVSIFFICLVYCMKCYFHYSR